MASVDFSNAHIEPSQNNPLKQTYAGLSVTRLNNSGGTQIGSCTPSRLVLEARRLVYSYSVSFTAAGTEFYMFYGNTYWRVYNISFANGDTGIFQVDAGLII